MMRMNWIGVARTCSRCLFPYQATGASWSHRGLGRWIGIWFLAVLLIPTGRSSGCRAGEPEVWLSNTRIQRLFLDKPDGEAFDSHWRFVYEHIDGIKFWDALPVNLDQDRLTDLFGKLRRQNIKFALEKGRWPVPRDLFEPLVDQADRRLQPQAEADPSLRGLSEGQRRDLARARVVEDRGEMLDSYDPEEFARKAAVAEIGRLQKIQAAGGLDLLDFIDLDGPVIKNVFPYRMAGTQGRVDVPDEQHFRRGFETPEGFFVAFRKMREILDEAMPEAKHVRYRFLVNFHFYTYRQPVQPELQPDGSVKYRHVDFHRFRDQTLDFHDVLQGMAKHRGLFYAVTTDYPYELYRMPRNVRRYRAMAREAKELGLGFAPILNAMSASKSMQQLHDDTMAMLQDAHKNIQPDIYLIQHWGEHPTVDELMVSEDEEGSFLNSAKKTLIMVEGRVGGEGGAAGERGQSTAKKGNRGF